MYEKENVLIAKFADYNIPWDDKLRQSLVEGLIGRPIVIYVAGVRQKIGVVRQTRLGREGIFADLVLETEEIAVAKLDESGKLAGFVEVKIKHAEEQVRPLDREAPSFAAIVAAELKDLQEKLEAETDQRMALQDALNRMSQKMAEEQIAAMEGLKEAELTIRKKLQVAEQFIYVPTDFEEYNRELKLAGLPPSDPSIEAHTLKARIFEGSLIAGEDLEAGELIVPKDGKAWSAKPRAPAPIPKPEEPKPKRSRKRKET